MKRLKSHEASWNALKLFGNLFKNLVDFLWRQRHSTEVFWNFLQSTGMLWNPFESWLSPRCTFLNLLEPDCFNVSPVSSPVSNTFVMIGFIVGVICEINNLFWYGDSSLLSALTAYFGIILLAMFDAVCLDVLFSTLFYCSCYNKFLYCFDILS